MRLFKKMPSSYTQDGIRSMGIMDLYYSSDEKKAISDGDWSDQDLQNIGCNVHRGVDLLAAEYNVYTDIICRHNEKIVENVMTEKKVVSASEVPLKLINKPYAV